MKITSAAFTDGDRIPTEHTGEGADRSPPLAVTDVPDQARSLALIVDDPDAPGGAWVHWLAWGIPPGRTEIPDGVPGDPVADTLDGARQGENDFGDIGWGGPLPPRGHGTHHYRFTVYALDGPLDLEPCARRDRLDAAMEGHVLATARLTGTYERS